VFTCYNSDIQRKPGPAWLSHSLKFPRKYSDRPSSILIQSVMNKKSPCGNMQLPCNLVGRGERQIDPRKVVAGRGDWLCPVSPRRLLCSSLPEASC
jgi:hypothetical protein